MTPQSLRSRLWFAKLSSSASLTDDAEESTVHASESQVEHNPQIQEKDTEVKE